MRGVVVSALVLAWAATAHAQAVRTIQSGETLQGELTQQDAKDSDDTPIDIYRFEAVAGRTYEIVLRSDAFDAFLQLRQGGTVIRQDDDGGGGTDSRISYQADANGTFEVLAGVLSNAAGPYSLSLSETATPPAPAARTISLGETLRGALTPNSPHHDDDTPYQPFVFAGRAGQRVAINMTSDAFDAYLVLRRAGSTDTLAFDDDGGGNTSARITQTLPETGDYEIRANAVSPSAEGDFLVSVSEAPAPPEPVLQPITYGRIVRGALDAQDAFIETAGTYYDLFQFEGRKGERVRVTLSSQAFDAFLGVSALGSNEQLQTDDDSGGGTDAMIELDLPENGPYRIMVTSLIMNQTGDYVLGLSRD